MEAAARRVFTPRRQRKDNWLTILSVAVITAYALCCLLPFVYIFFVSFMSYDEYTANPLRVIPSHIDLTAYSQMLDYNLLRTGYAVTLFITAAGTALSVFLLVVSAYPLSKSELKGRNFIMGMIMFTMFFSGGMIPDYLLVRYLGLYNSVWALILPGCLNAFYLILMKNFIKASIPESLEETARLEGAGYTRILFSIVFPLMMPAIATMVVFCAVGYWNNYFSAMLYISDRKYWPLSLVLRELVVQNDTSAVSPVTQMLNSTTRAHPFTLRMAAIVITIVPILAVYPFMQRFFVKGIFLGSVKG
jgi:putative aldouronate transport system permease protein